MKVKSQNIFEDDNYLLNTEHYKIRDSQIDMANLIEKSLYENSYSVLEAETGTGKSYAYLIPCMLYASTDKDNIRIIISTATLNLQDQLFKKDIPFLKKILNSDLNINYFSGRQNYLCKRSVLEAIKDQKASEKLLKQLNDSVNNNECILINELDYTIPYPLVNEINCSIDDCTKGKCSYFTDCHYYNAKKKAFDSNILIINHKLLLNDAKLRYESKEIDLILPSFNNLIIDEAHNLESITQDSFTSEVSLKYLNYLISTLSETSINKKVDFFIILSKTLTKTELKLFKEIVQDLIRYSNILIDKEAFYDEKLVNEDNIDLYIEHFQVLEPILNILNTIELLLLTSSSKLEERTDGDTRSFLKFKTQVDRILILKKYLNTFLNDNSENIVKSIKSTNDDTVYISRPLEVANILQESLYQTLSCSIFVSATLDLGDNFEYYLKSTGLDTINKKVITKKYPSPFNYKKNLLILASSNLIEYSKENSVFYINEISNQIKNIILTSEGNALILFTNYTQMQSVYDIVLQEIDSDYNLLKQDNFSNRHQLLNEFKEKEKSALFATSSFWQGIDVPGDDLQVVVIVKLPFSVPTTPLSLARKLKKEKENKSFFKEVVVPDAIMKLKQGVGRLIRRETDRGIVVILDSRIVTKNYGKHLLNSMVDCNKIVCEKENITEQIERFLY